MYLLDTNHCSDIILCNNSVLVNKINSIDNDALCICVIVEGELIFMAKNSERPYENQRIIQHFTSCLKNYPIDSKVANTYSAIKADLFKKFGPKEKSKRRKYKIQKLGISDNDLWIASIALLNNLVLLSHDSDFARIGQVCGLEVESWL